MSVSSNILVQTSENDEIKAKKVLSNSTNMFNNSAAEDDRSTRNCRRRRQHGPLTLATFRRYKHAYERKIQLAALIQDKTQIQVEPEPLIDIQNFQKEQEAQLQRAMYNARQTPLIPLVTDIDYSELMESSKSEDDLLRDVLTLINHMDEEYTFFEQFRI